MPPMIGSLGMPPKEGAAGLGIAYGDPVSHYPYHLVTVLLQVGAMDTGATLDIKIQEADNPGGTFTDIPGAVFATIYDGSANEVRLGIIHITGTRQLYFRVAENIVGGSVSYSVAFLMDFEPRDEAPGAEWRVVD